jgi:hypothetical protein
VRTDKDLAEIEGYYDVRGSNGESRDAGMSDGPAGVPIPLSQHEDLYVGLSRGYNQGEQSALFRHVLLLHLLTIYRDSSRHQ